MTSRIELPGGYSLRAAGSTNNYFKLYDKDGEFIPYPYGKVAAQAFAAAMQPKPAIFDCSNLLFDPNDTLEERTAKIAAMPEYVELSKRVTAALAQQGNGESAQKDKQP